MKLYLLGTHPALSVAELNAMGLQGKLYRGKDWSYFESKDKIPIEKLGGSQKRYHILHSGRPTIEDLVNIVCRQLLDAENGRLSHAFHCSDEEFNFKQILAAHKQVEKRLSQKIRLINQNTININTASSVHNKTYKQEKAFEFYVGKNGIAVLDDVQNLKRYADRDQKRPKRDARIGMLPPKLAQMMVNIAAGPSKSMVLDPFCGTGVVLQEAMINGHDVIGSDINPLMIDYSQENLEWIKQKYKLSSSFDLQIGDAANHNWGGFDAVASETYLGTPLSSRISAESAAKAAQELEPLQKQFLSNLSKNMPTGARACLAFPAWILKSSDYFNSLVIDKTVFDAYNLQQIELGNQNEYHYSRSNQSVARCIVILKKV